MLKIQDYTEENLKECRTKLKKLMCSIIRDN